MWGVICEKRAICSITWQWYFTGVISMIITADWPCWFGNAQFPVINKLYTIKSFSSTYQCLDFRQWHLMQSHLAVGLPNVLGWLCAPQSNSEVEENTLFSWFFSVVRLSHLMLTGCCLLQSQNTSLWYPSILLRQQYMQRSQAFWGCLTISMQACIAVLMQVGGKNRSTHTLPNPCRWLSCLGGGGW